jgi:DNA primase
MLPDGKDPDDLVRNDGAAAMEKVLADARPLADLLWQRETEGGIPQTPERRAGLEARVLGAIRVIADPAVRNHYQADMRARLRQIFEPARANWAGGGAKPGFGQGPARLKGRHFAGRGFPQGPLPPTSSLLESALAKGADLPHDRMIDLIFGVCLGHIDLLVDNAERLAALEPRAPWRMRLRDGLISALGINHLDSAVLNDHLNKLGLANEVDALRQRVLANPEWASARPGSDRPAAAALLMRGFDAVETGQGAGELALRAERDAIGGEVDADLADQISSARREIEAARIAALEENMPT